MNLTENIKSPILDTAGRTQSYQYGNTSNSPPESVSFRQSPSPSRLNTFTHIKDHPLNHYLSRQSHPGLTNSPSGGIRSYIGEDIDQMIIEHRMEVESLLLQIGRLQQQLHQSHELRALQSKTIKQQYDQLIFAQTSQQRQSHQAQIQVYELQIRKIKEQLHDKSDQAKRLHQLLLRQKQSKEVQKIRFNEEVRLLIAKKNSEVFQQRQEGQNRVRQLEEAKKSQVDQLRYSLNKQIRSLNNLLEQRRQQVERIKTSTERQEKQKIQQIQSLQSELQSIQRRSEQRLSRQMEKYDNIRIKFNQLITEFSQIGMKSRSELQQLFEAEYSQLMALLKAKQSEIHSIKRQKQTEIAVFSTQSQALKHENYLLQKKVSQTSQNAVEDMELLKVKLAALHQNDITQLKDLYELKLKNLSANIYRMDQQNSKLRELTNLLSAEKYETKKCYEITISELNSRILKMRMGMSNMESDFREKIENEKSLMLMTSKSFLKQAEAKNSSHKFLEEEIRKLRQLMDLQSRENENSEKVVQQRIQAANYELQQLSNRVLSIAKEKKDLQEEMAELRREKDEEIGKLRAQLNFAKIEQAGIIPQLKIIQEQRHQLASKKQEISILKDKVHTLESRMKQMQAEGERLQMQNNIHIDEAKKEFHIIAEQHLKEFKSYYQQKLKVAQEEKGELKKIISSQYEKITQLIKKYKQTEEGLKEATKMMKKRTQLEEKVMNIGLDTNLVKNLSQLLPTPKNH